jgi:hypothetical protein
MSNHSKIKPYNANIHLKRILKNRVALSTVVTTLIILVISVLLASVVTYFAINVVSTRVQEESLHLTKQHIWHNSTADAGSAGYSQACDWNSTETDNDKFVLYSVTNNPVQSDMVYTSGFNSTGDNTITLGSQEYTFHVAGSDLVLRSGYTLLLYIVNPDSITINDIGLTVSITLYTAQAMYYREANVQAVS